MITDPRTVGDIPALWASRQPGSAAMRTKSGSERTYGELDERTDRLANGLLSTGLRPGDRVATWMRDGFAYVELYLAAAKAGLVVSPINARLTPNEAEYLLRDSDPGLLVWTDDLDDHVAGLSPSALGGRRRLRVTSGADCELESALTASTAGAPDVDVTPDSPLILGYTSGTTGRPKGAVLTHRSILEVGRINATSYRLTAYPRVALTGSMSFVSVVPAHVLCTLRLGGCLTLMDRWTVDELVEILERDLITFTYIPSPLMSDVAKALARHPRSWTNLRSVLHSASRARPEQLHALIQVIGNRLVEGWGMTENSGGLMTATLGHEYQGKGVDDPVFTSVGRPTLDTAVRVLDANGDDLPHDGVAVGELVFAAPSLMTGYWNRPDDTASSLVDGWFHTGDLGSIDADGYVYVSDRRTDLIVSGGANVYPGEVEDCIARLDGVVEVAVVGVPHERWGQTVVALVVTSDPTLDEHTVIEHCRLRLAGYKKPTSVLFTDSLPRTASMKVSRSAARRMAHDQLNQS